MIWTEGDTALLRFCRLDGSLGQVHPLRVLSDDGQRLVGWLPRDTPIVGTRLEDGTDPRDLPLEVRFTTPRKRFPDTWRRTSTLRVVDDNEWSSTWWFFDSAGEFLGWYVNLEIPLGRGESTVDRVDGALDVWVEPDRRWEWKDEDEADASVDAGRMTAEHLAQLRAEGERLIALAEAARFPFDGTWCDFRPDPSWPAPTLPATGW
ncbi:DUF402 domain-containing protein [Kutzneria viridogrisea]|uniref:DUF402 domain-containing protein n=2 Tax=Kutzneria TaxID=43356 RepID=W5WAT0_9PSEU|nr:DUF402 domain-containing protein [Kutzneria albida]AHH95319.1 hypothetical protein KALB_1949 [Kutzneria albida DSM 43870]MBA8927324.1 hypothetical protein [Kutzneria viridogrisea]